MKTATITYTDGRTLPLPAALGYDPCPGMNPVGRAVGVSAPQSRRAAGEGRAGR